MSPFVSILIPVRNEERFLARCLRSVLSSDYPRDRMEVLVVDGMSTDGTRSLIEQFAAADARVRRIDNEDQTTPMALNRGIEQARGEILARVDAHAAIAPDYVSRCVAHLLSSGADNVGGAIRTLPQSAGLFAGPIVAALSHRFGVGNSHFRIGSIESRRVDTVFGGCWRREVFDRVGGFNPQLRRTQDLEFNLRLKAAGLWTLLAADVKSDYYARSDFRSFARHNFLNGEWAVLPFVYSDVIPVSLRHMIPLAFALGLLAGAALLPWSWWPLAAVAGPYVLANFIATIDVALRERRCRFVFLMPVIFFTLHLTYGFGSISGVFQAAVICLQPGRPRPVPSKEKSCIPQP